MSSDAVTENTRAIVELFWRTMNGGDPQAVERFMHRHFAADLEWSVVGSGVPGAGTHKGIDNVLRIIGGVRRLFEPGYPRGEVIHQVVEGQWAAAEMRASGPLRDGRLYENRYAFFIRVKDDRIASIREYFDTHYVNQLIGDHLE